MPSGSGLMVMGVTGRGSHEVKSFNNMGRLINIAVLAALGALTSFAQMDPDLPSAIHPPGGRPPMFPHLPAALLLAFAIDSFPSRFPVSDFQFQEITWSLNS